jgi:hypothetical protein
MVSNSSGQSTPIYQVTAIGAQGFWLLEGDAEYFVPFGDYPVFRTATVSQIFALQRLAPGQYHWPELDADVELAALQQPDRFPLLFKP